MTKPMDKSVKKSCLLFLFACYFLYLISISIKMVYSAQTVSIMDALGDTDGTITSLALTFYYVTYTIGQLVLSLFIKKINMKWFMTISVFLSAVSFGLIPVFNDLVSLYVIMALNGLFQTGIWGGIMHFVGKYIPKQMSAFTTGFLGTGLALGTAITYGISALFVAQNLWEYTFLFFGVITIISLVTFLLALKYANNKLAHVEQENLLHNQAIAEQSQTSQTKQGSIAGIIAILIATVITAASIYYAYTQWFPNLLKEEFGMDNSYSILITMLLPVSIIPSPFVTAKMLDKSKKLFNVPILFMGIVSVLLLGITFCFSVNIVLTLVVSVVTLFFLRGIINMICTYCPLRFKDKIDSGKLALILNASATLVAGVIPFVSRIIVREAGWLEYFILLAALSVATVIIFGVGRLIEFKHDKKTPDVNE